MSHSHVKTKRRFEPNLVQASLHSDMLGRTVRMRIAARELRTVDKLGGLDAYLQKARSEQLSPRLQKVKREIETRLSEAAS